MRSARILQVTSCLIQAGNGICNKPDRKVAIQENLSCVFGLLGEEVFGTCLKEKLIGAIQVSVTVYKRGGNVHCLVRCRVRISL